MGRLVRPFLRDSTILPGTRFLYRLVLPNIGPTCHDGGKESKMPKASPREFVSYRAVRTANSAVREKSAATRSLGRDAATGQFVPRETVTSPRDSHRVSRTAVVQFSKVSKKR